MTDNPLFVRALAVIYGERGQTAAAADLGIADRTVRRFVAGDPVRPSIYAELADIAARRRGELAEIEAELRAAAPPP